MTDYDDGEHHCPVCGEIVWGMPSSDNVHCYICAHCYKYYDLFLNQIDKEEFLNRIKMYSDGDKHEQ